VTALPPYEDGILTEEAQGPFAPEELAGPVFSRRFIQDLGDGTFTVVTDYYAATISNPDEERYAAFDVCNIVEVTTCTDPTDPGGTEIDSEYDREYVNYLAYGDEKDATEAARLNTKHLSIGVYGWADFE
jgi:hypothetical protein